MTRYKGDPYWTKARFDSVCCRCGKQICKGELIYYYPNNKRVYCDADACGQKCAREFSAAQFDEG